MHYLNSYSLRFIAQDLQERRYHGQKHTTTHKIGHVSDNDFPQIRITIHKKYINSTTVQNILSLTDI